jgi:ribosomal protein L11 methylase PrmA
MDWSVHTAVVADGDLAAVEEALAIAGFTAHAIASRSDGRHDLTLYGADGRLPEDVTATLDRLGIAIAGGTVSSEGDLLRGYLPEDPIELAPGWWIDPLGRLPAEHGGRILRVPPSTAFGDGHHPSTRMATRRLLTLPLDGARVLDLGCGTGVLGLVAGLCGAAQVDLTDIDPAAVAATDATLTAHGLCGHRAVVADLLGGVPGSAYTIVAANIYADLIVDILADPRLAAVLPHGHLVLSGIAERKLPLVQDALAAAGFAIDHVETEAWWCCVGAHR